MPPTFVSSDLIGTLESNSTLEVVDLSGNNIDSAILKEIDSLLRERKSESGRQESSKGSSKRNLGVIVHRVAENDPKLAEINLDGTDLSNDSNVEELIDALTRNTVVTKLSLNSTNFDDTLIAALSLALVDNRTIRTLELTNNQITSEGCEYVSN